MRARAPGTSPVTLAAVMVSPSTVAPSAARISSMTPVSVTSAALRIVTGSEVSRQAARIGRVAFLEPPMQIRPASSRPPRTRRTSSFGRSVSRAGPILRLRA